VHVELFAVSCPVADKVSVVGTPITTRGADTEPPVGNEKGIMTCIWNGGRLALASPYTPYPTRTPCVEGTVTALNEHPVNPVIPPGLVVHDAPSVDTETWSVEPVRATR
jgi:hypothetical protein